MPGEEFDMAGAVSEISSGLGLGEVTDPSTGDVNLTPPGDPGITDPDSAAPSGEVTDPAAPTADPEPAPADPAAPTAPRTWRAEAAAEFANLPEVVRAEILKREEDIFQGIEQYKADAAFGNSIKAVLDPYMPVLQQYGIRPDAQVADMMQAHYTLAFGSPEQKLALIQQVAQDYKVDLSAIGAAPAYTDPQVESLQKELASLKSQLMGMSQAQTEAKKGETIAHVQKFASDPKNVYFDELANDIAHLLRTGAEKTVEAAYEKAMWMNPVVRAKELQRQQTEKAEAQRKADAEKTAAAKKAASANVSSRAKSGSATAPLGSMDDTLAETLATIKAKS